MVRLPLATLLVAALAGGACGPVDRTVTRPLVTDQTPLGSSRADVKAWHLAHDWCEGRTWERSDEYYTCVPRAYEGRESDRVRALFRFEGGVAVAGAVFAPVPCTRRDCPKPLGVSTSLEDPPFVIFDAGLVAHPTAVGHDQALTIEMPPDQTRLMDAMQVELQGRYGPPDWTSPTGTGRVWSEPRETIGLFLSADGLWTIETHELPSGPPGQP